MARLPHLRRAVAIVLAAGIALIPGGVAQAGKTLRCKSADLRYPYQPGGPKTFGVFKLQITGGHCSTAHRIAKTWMKRFEADLRRGRVKLPKNVDGYAFKTLPAHAAQTYTERGKKRSATIRFDYVVPNG